MAGTSYTRQSTLTDGDTITAGLFNNEYNQIVSAFSYTTSGTTGHQHDGSAGQGGNIHTIGDQDFLNKIVVDTANNRVGFFIEVSGTATEQVRVEDGAVVPVTDNDVDLGSSSVQFKDLFLNGTANIDALVLTSGSTVTTILNEDNMSSDSDTALATQQSIKAYVDAQVTAQDLDLTDGTTVIAIDLDSETLSILGGTGITSTASGNGVTLSIDGTVTTLTGTQTLTNKTIDADNNTIQNLEVDNLKSGVLDTDISSVSSSDDTLPSAKAVKTYVDAQVTAQDLDFQGDSGGALNIDLDSETLTVAGGTGIDTSGATNTLTVAIDSTVATLTDTQTLTNKTLTTPIISGNLTTDGTIDGRDVAADGTKLDGIEASATADQTAAEIRTLVESATDSNVFTDADHSKLNAIESGATADQTAAEIKTAYESNADTNAFTDADHTKLDGIEANATADQTDAEIRAAVEAATDSNVFTDADHSKLNAIEASADVTDTTNVVAALTAGSNITIAADGTIASTASGGEETLQETLGFGNTVTTDTKIQFRDTGLYINSSADGQLDIVADTEVQIAATTVDVNGVLDVSGNIVAGGTVDGRDVAADGTKLDGIEASADVTDTANVTAAGAVMDSELTSEASVKALNQGVATTDSPTFAGLTVDTDTLYVDSTNNRVGVGTTSPSNDLHVSSATGSAKLTSTGGGANLFMESADGNATRIRWDSNANFTIRNDATSSDVFNIDQSGNVGIGTSSPSATDWGSSNQVLQISGTQPLLSLEDTDTGEFQIANSGQNLYFWDAVANSNRMLIDSSGNVGIGTTAIMQDFGSGRTTLALKGAASTDYSTLQLGNYGTNANDQIHGVINFYDGTDSVSRIQSVRQSTALDSYLAFYTAPSAGGITERMRIDSTGRVGINTTSTTGGRCTIESGATSTPALVVRKNSTTGNTFTVRNTATSDSTFGIGVYNTVTSLDAYASSGGQSQNITFRRGSSGETMRCASNGRVGIGTTAPTQALHVVGSIVATGNITAYYSDERLKNLMGTIPSALDKVSKLNGYYYTPNTTALSLGVESKGVEVGVSAQEIEAVLPEIIADSVVGKGYKTVMYEKITPLLIEAIKELTDKVSSLEAKVKKMEK